MRWIWVLCVAAACGGGGDDGDCRDGEIRACYTGPDGTQDVGTCKAGVETCVDGKFPGICIGDVTPFVEHCDGLDEDCNNTVDDVEEAGAICMSADGCEGAKACTGAVVSCVAPKRNACDVCGGVDVTDVGTSCAVGNCSGARVCNLAGDGTDCNAPAENECAVCGGPPVANLGNDCIATSGCPGIDVCNVAGTGATCDCNPEPGLCRDGAAFRPVVAPVIGDLVITELLPSPSGDDNFQEWFEVEVIRDVDLNEVKLDRAGDAVQPDPIQSVDCLRVTAGTRLVFAKNADPAQNGGLPTVTATFTFALVAGSAASPGDIRVLAPDNSVVDAVSWTSSRSTKALQLDPDFVNASSNDSEANFCDATTSYNGGSDLGTPGAVNAQCAFAPPAGQCTDGAINRPIVKPLPGQLVITEFLANPAGTGDATREWFEVTNTGATAFDLNELTVKNPASSTLIQSVTCIPVAAGSFALLARSTDPVANAGLPTPDATFSFTLVDSGVNAGITVADGATDLDSVVWTAVTSGKALGLDPDHFNTADNDTAAVTAGVYCLATAPYGDATNLGTPRAANPQCP